jgi:predicted RNA-binding Zn ribbon-like protein
VKKRADTFEWSGGHPALDFVNTLDERSFESPIETLATYRDLVQFAHSAGMIPGNVAKRLRNLEGSASIRIARRARELLERLHGILAAAHAGQPISRVGLDAVAMAVRAAHAARVIVAPGSLGIAEVAWKSPIAPDVPLHACALAIEHLLLEVDRDRIHKCAASDCDVYFIDTSKGHRRQWCSMGNCGNREKQRRWRLGA